MAKRLFRIPFSDLNLRSTDWVMRSGSLVFKSGEVVPLQFQKVEGDALLCRRYKGTSLLIAFSAIQEIIVDQESAH